jgi:hypothetical protein
MFFNYYYFFFVPKLFLLEHLNAKETPACYKLRLLKLNGCSTFDDDCSSRTNILSCWLAATHLSVFLSRSVRRSFSNNCSAGRDIPEEHCELPARIEFCRLKRTSSVTYWCRRRYFELCSDYRTRTECATMMSMTYRERTAANFLRIKRTANEPWRFRKYHRFTYKLRVLYI